MIESRFNLTQYKDRMLIASPYVWEWSTCYAIHGWNQVTHSGLFGSFGELSLQYVLAQKSNIAKAQVVDYFLS